MRRIATLLLVLLLAACDRAGLEEPPMETEVPGTFELTIRQLGGSGFETVSGSAVFAQTGRDLFVVRLSSPLPMELDTTTVDLIVALDEVLLRETAGPMALCYRSDIFPDGPYRGESGTLRATMAPGAPTLHGVLDATAFADLQTGPETTTRIRVEIEGTFSALPGAPGVDGTTVSLCERS